MPDRREVLPLASLKQDESRPVLAPGVDLPPVETVSIPIDRLKHATWNPKSPISGVSKTGLGANIEEFGFDDELKVWPDPDEPGTFIVINGNQRLTILRESGVRSVHCEVKADFDPERARLYTAARDRNTARHDESKLADLAGTLKARADLVKRLLRADRPAIPPPPQANGGDGDGEPRDTPAPRPEVGPTVPVMFALTREGHEELRASLLKTKDRLKREERLLQAFRSFSDREMDDLAVETVLRVAAMKDPKR